MIAFSSPGFRPGFSSTSRPRARKISTARGLSSSLIRTLGCAISAGLGQGGLDLAIGPVEPWQQRLDVGGLDRSAGPQPQARRRIAMVDRVIGGAVLLEQFAHALHHRDLLGLR